MLKKSLFSRHQMAQSQNSQAPWRIPENNGIGIIADPTEVIVGGVYLRLFVANPGWTLRKPKEFLSELMETCLNMMSRDKPVVHASNFSYLTQCHFGVNCRKIN